MVLNQLRKYGKNEDLSLEKLSKKLTMLMNLVTAQQVQTLSKIRINDMMESQNLTQIKLSKTIKTSRHNRCQPILKIPIFQGSAKPMYSHMYIYVELRS